MPLYSYRCAECDSVADHFFRFSDRPPEYECTECEGMARYVIAVSKAQSNDPHEHKKFSSERTSGLALHEYMCNVCKHHFDEIIDFSKGEKHDGPQQCPKCDVVDSRWIPCARIDRFSETFPHYDRGLGVMLTSKQHRRDVCKARGLTPVDGDWNVDKEFDKFDSENQKDEKEYADYCDRLDNHPAFASWRKANDQGRV